MLQALCVKEAAKIFPYTKIVQDIFSGFPGCLFNQSKYFQSFPGKFKGEAQNDMENLKHRNHEA